MNQSKMQSDQKLKEIVQSLIQNQSKKEGMQKSLNLFTLLLYQLCLDNDVFQSKFNFLPFGSSINGFGTNESDIDLTITTCTYINEEVTLNKIAQLMKCDKQFKLQNNFSSARIPVLKFYDVLNRIKIDLCINNLVGAINSHLLYAYSQLDLKVQFGGILIKIWGKTQALINKQQLSSYSIIILWIYYLQQNHNLPNLQDLNNKPPNLKSILTLKRTIKSQECIFELDPFFIYQGDLYNKFRQEFQQYIIQFYLTDLLKGFFQYYSTIGIGFNNKISINGKQQKNIQYKYQMVDPIDLEHDPLQKIRENFKKQAAFDFAEKYILDTQYYELLFKQQIQ